jgi:hypothetical protein
VPNLSPLTYGPIDPWGSFTQFPDVTGLLATSEFTDAKYTVCPTGDPELNGVNLGDYVYPEILNGQTIGFLPTEVLNALRLGIGTLSACWTANFETGESGSGGPLSLTMVFTYNGPAGSGVSDVVGTINAQAGYESNCGDGDDGDTELQAITAIAAGCNDTNDLLDQSQFQSASLPADISSYIEPAVTQALTSLQGGVYNDLISNIQSGDSPAPTDVQAAAKRLDGANALLDGYVSLGLPQALTSDDTLESLIAGQNEDAFALTDPRDNPWGVAFASNVPDALIDLYQAALTTLPNFDPTQLIAKDVLARAADLDAAISPHIVNATVPTSMAARERSAGLGQGLREAAVASGSTTPDSGVLAEDNPLIAPTIATLSQTGAGLSDLLADGAQLFVTVGGTGSGSVASSGATPDTGSGIGCPGSCSAAFAPGATVTLSATPAAGSTFAGWSGACSGTGACTVTLDYDDEVTGTFAASGPTTGPTTTPTPPTLPTTTTPTTTTPTTTTPTTTTTTTTPTTTTTVVTTPTRTPTSTAAAVSGQKCSISSSGTVSRTGKLTLSVRCRHATKVAISGSLVSQTGRKTKRGKQITSTTRLKAVRATLKANRATTFAVGLPPTARSAVARRRKVMVTFTLTAGSTKAKSRPVSVKAKSAK